MSEVLKEYKPGDSTDWSSKEIIEQFIKSENDAMVVDHDALGKKKQNVYAALRSHISRNVLPVKVSFRKGSIVLSKS
ncbi:hypothetical protein KAT92_06395 [Candidatus Babeliales bacterium]|nr:hypothetical protein [Candidatus Babeliales bacterium]